MSAALEVETLTTLLDATRRLASVQDETSVIQTIADRAMTVFEAPGAALFIGGADTAVLAGVSGGSAALPAEMRLSPSRVSGCRPGSRPDRARRS